MKDGKVSGTTMMGEGTCGGRQGLGGEKISPAATHFPRLHAAI